MKQKLLPYKSPLRFLIAVGFILAIALASNDILINVFFKTARERVKLDIIKLIFYDLGIALIFNLIILIPYLLLYRVKELLANIFLIAITSIFLLINLSLNQYYVKTHVSLGSDIYGYSFEEIIMIVNSSTEIKIKEVLLFAIFPTVFYSAIYAFRFYTKKVRYLFYPLLLGFLYFILSPFVDSHPINNFMFFITESMEYKGTKKAPEVPLTWEGENKYPLLSANSLSNNVLGENLNLSKDKPNIVMIVVEGLGSDFCGAGAQYKGFTPYLDSLSKQSLYWSNFMSNAGRSFGALPSILGSAPFGDNGFLELPDLPDHLSLIGLLKQNDYLTSYFEGGDSSFDKKINYLNNEGVDNLTDQSSFGPGYTLTKSNEGGFSWGYPDKEIFKKTLTLIQPAIQPRFDIILTISNHEPFVIPNQDFYRNKVTKMLDKNMFEGDEEDNVEDFKDVFSVLLYTDEAIKEFMEKYKSHPNYANTIFIITGDHRLIPVPQQDVICRYHVPLMVYSPMLKAPKEYKGIGSHMDIMPSIMSLLKNNYEAKIPEKLPFLGRGLSNSTSFVANAEIPLTRHKGAFKDLIINDNLLSGNDMYKIHDNLYITEAGGSPNFLDIQKRMTRLQQINTYVTTKNMLIPEEMRITAKKKEIFTKEQKARLAQLTKSTSNTENFKLAQQFAWNKRRADALLLCDLIIKDSPKSFDTRTLKGRIYSWEGEIDKAEEELMFIVKRNPTYQDSYRAAITMFWWHGQEKKARKLAETARKNCSNDPEFMQELNVLMGKFKNNGKSPAKKEEDESIASNKQ